MTSFTDKMAGFKKDVLIRMREAKDADLTGRDPEKVVELTAKSYGLSDPERKDTLVNFVRNNDRTVYGLAQAVTETANTTADYDRASQLESTGWGILTMPDKTYRELAAVSLHQG